MAPMDNRFLCPRSKGDPDALAYIAAVQQADGEPLEQAVKTAIEAFVVGCKADSAGYAGDPTRTVWDALQACCIMCGARTISGALVPLVGTAPTPYNFAGGDYSRTTGLKGNGSTKYLDSNRADSADGQDDHHIAVYSTEGDPSTAKYPMGVWHGGSSYTLVGRDYWSRSTSAAGAVAAVETGTYALSRGSGSSFNWMRGGVLQTPAAKASTSSTNGNSHFVFGYNSGAGVAQVTSARLAFYSIGSALDLAALDNRVSTLVSAIAAAI